MTLEIELQKQILKTLLDNGVPLSEISEQLGVSKIKLGKMMPELGYLNLADAAKKLGYGRSEKMLDFFKRSHSAIYSVMKKNRYVSKDSLPTVANRQRKVTNAVKCPYEYLTIKEMAGLLGILNSNFVTFYRNRANQIRELDPSCPTFEEFQKTRCIPKVCFPAIRTVNNQNKKVTQCPDGYLKVQEIAELLNFGTNGYYFYTFYKNRVDEIRELDPNCPTFEEFEKTRCIPKSCIPAIKTIHGQHKRVECPEGYLTARKIAKLLDMSHGSSFQEFYKRRVNKIRGLDLNCPTYEEFEKTRCMPESCLSAIKNIYEKYKNTRKCPEGYYTVGEIIKLLNTGSNFYTFYKNRLNEMRELDPSCPTLEEFKKTRCIPKSCLPAIRTVHEKYKRKKNPIPSSSWPWILGGLALGGYLYWKSL